MAEQSKAAKVNIICAEGNEVHVSQLAEGRGDIMVTGTGNRVEFGPGAKFKGTIEVQGKNNTVIFGANSVIRGKVVVKGSKQIVSVGDHTTFQSVYLLCDENCDLRIGKWCMFSRDIEVRTTDAHSVVDAVTLKRINQPESVTIGDHVWVGVGALISKGVKIADDCIVGAASFVNGEFAESQVVIAGMPAKIVKRGVTWNRSRRASFSSEEINVWRSS